MSAYTPPTYYFPGIDFNDNFFTSSSSNVNDNLLVHKAGTETITGNKTITGALTANGLSTFSGFQTIFNNGISVTGTSYFFGQTSINNTLITSTDIISSVPYSSSAIMYSPSVVNPCSLLISSAVPSGFTAKAMTYDVTTIAGSGGTAHGLNSIIGYSMNLPRGLSVSGISLYPTASSTALITPFIYSTSGSLLTSGSPQSIISLNVPNKFSFSSAYTIPQADNYFVGFIQTNANANFLQIPNQFGAFQTPTANVFNLKAGNLSSINLPVTLTGTLTANTYIDWLALY